MAKSIFRKALVICTMLMLAMSNGIFLGQQTGMLSSLKKQEDGLSLSDNQISLMTSTISVMITVGIGSAAAVTDKIGRRHAFVLFSAINVLNWIILYYGKELFVFLLSRFIGGIGFGGTHALCAVITSEYTSPKTRAFFLHMVITVSAAIGTGLGHILGIILHWRTVGLIAMIAGAFGIMIPYSWVESPYWLASKGRFEECEQTFWKLYSKNPNTKAQLGWLIKVEKSKLEEANLTNSVPTLKRLYLAFRKKYFWKLMLLSMFMHIYLAASGKLLFSVFATTILEDITGSSDILLYTLLVDAFFVVGSCMSLVFIRLLTLKKLVFITGSISNIILVILSVCLYFKIGKDIHWINVILMGAYFIILNSGPYPSIEALLGEIFPLELKVYCYFIMNIVVSVLYALILYLFPLIVYNFGYHSFYLIQVAVMIICLIIIWFRLPETKGRTLQEIEVYFKTNIFDVDEALSNEELKSFI